MMDRTNGTDAPRTVSRLRSAAAVLAALVLWSAPAAAQAPAATPSADEQAALGVVTGLFDAMRQRDTTALRQAFLPGAMLASSGMRDGAPTATVQPIDAWVRSIASAPPGLVLDERLYNPQVRIADGLATVWVDYDFYAGDRFSHCGVDAFTLLRSADGWKVAHVADTRQREGCPTR